MRKILLLSMAILFPLYATAVTDISVTASVNKTSLSMGEELLLNVTVEGTATQDNPPQLPSLPAFNVFLRSADANIYTSYAVTNFEYVLIPRFPGKTVIEPITFSYRNNTYQTDPITVTVYRDKQETSTQRAPANKPSALQKSTDKKELITAKMTPLERSLYQQALRKTNKDYFMVTAAGLSEALVNQNFIVSVRFYYARPFADGATYTPPSVTNLFLEEVERTEGRQVLQTKHYNYIEIRYMANGVTADKAEIGPADITYMPISTRDISFFDQVFASVSTQSARTARSNSISIPIHPVPLQNQPKSFYGAVGAGYSISASLDRDEVEAGEAVNLTVKVNGPGNLKATSDLRMPPLNGFKVYDVVSNAGSVPSKGNLKSYKIFKTVLVPLSSGEYTLPALSWSYYDPNRKEYRTLQTQPLPLRVLPSSKVDSGFDFSAQTDLGNGFTELNRDIHYVKSALAPASSNFLAKISQYNALVYVALAMLLLAFWNGFVNRQKRHNKRSLSKVRTQLKRANSEQALADALSQYIQLTYGISTASLTLREIEQSLAKKGCPREVVQQFSSVWQQLDTLRFAPTALQGQGLPNLAQQALQVTKAMDKGEHK